MKKHYYTNAIIEICDENHCTVDEIYKTVLAKFPEAGKSSIYRNVEELVKKGELTKIIGIGKKCFFEKTKSHHAHFICKNSGKIIDIPLEEMGLDLSLQNTQVKNKYHISEIENLDIKIYGTLA